MTKIIKKITLNSSFLNRPDGWVRLTIVKLVFFKVQICRRAVNSPILKQRNIGITSSDRARPLSSGELGIPPGKIYIGTTEPSRKRIPLKHNTILNFQ